MKEGWKGGNLTVAGRQGTGKPTDTPMGRKVKGVHLFDLHPFILDSSNDWCNKYNSNNNNISR